MVFIYTLELEQGKYYIGKTNNPQFQINSHFNSDGTEWTKKYKPINVLEIIPNCHSNDEDKYTIKYMVKYGINNVRSGSFCELKIREENKNTLKRMINKTINNNEYFAKDYIQDEDEDEDEDENEFNKRFDELEELLVKHDLCFRCYRKGHYSNKCYAKTTISGEPIKDEKDEVFCCSYCDKKFDTLKGVTCHENLHCKKKHNKTIV